MAHHPHTPRNIKVTPTIHYHTQISSSLPPYSPQISLQKHIHTQIAHHSIKDKTQMLAQPQDIYPSESSLYREDRVHLARLRCGCHPALLSYQKRLDGSIANACPGCNTSSHTVKHITEDCTANNHTCQQHNIHPMKTLWESPVQATVYLWNSGSFGQAAWTTTTDL